MESGESTKTTRKKFALLESVAARFQQQNDERQKRAEKLEIQRELEKVHSQYLKTNVADHTELCEAKFVVDQWTKKHDSAALRHGRRILKPKRNRQTERTWNLDSPVSSVNFSHEQSRTLGSTVSAARGSPENKVENESQVPKEAVMDINDSVILLDSTLEGDSTINTESSPKPNEELHCPVVNCWTKFSSTDMMLRHMYRFAHCPCNPLADYPDCDIEGKTVGFACPQCWSIFQTKQFCSDHMKAENHKTYLTPLELVGYLCGECLAIFPSLMDCTSHIENAKHDDLSYPFREDMEHGGKQFRPVAITMAMAKHFYNKCQDVKFEVKCTDCGLLIKTDKDLKLHSMETNEQHIMSTMAEQTQVDVFLHYLCYGFCCDTCGSLCPMPQSADICHTCCPEGNVIGAIKELKCTTFVQFVRQCCIMCETEENKNIRNFINHSPKSKKKCKDKFPSLIAPSDTEMTATVFPSNESIDINIESNNSDCHIIEVESMEVESWSSVTEKTEVGQDPSSGTKKMGTQQAISGNTSDSVIFDNALQEKSSACTATMIPQCVWELTLPSKQNSNDQLEKISSDTLVDLTHLCKMKNIVFLDLDNWGGFFQKLPEPLSDKTFVWGFYGGSTVWKEPSRCVNYVHQRDSNRFYLHQKCGSRKDAADFAICLKVGQMDEKLPKRVAFTILSGDHGFREIEEQMKQSERRTVVVNPHDAQSMGDWVLYAMINSVGEA